MTLATALPRTNPEHVLHFLVVGGGIAGLSCAISLQRVGHRVTVFEQSDGTYRSEAILRCPPHMSRILYRWGITEDILSKEASTMDACIVHDGSNELQQVLMFHQGLMKELGAIYHLCQHGQVYGWLLDLARAEGAEIRFNSQVTDVDPHQPSVHLASGETITGDIVVGADGWNSAVRKVVSGGQPEALSTQGRVAYHMIVPDTLLRADPELKDMLVAEKALFWMADSCTLLTVWDTKEEQVNMIIFSNGDDPLHCDRRWDISYPLNELNLNLEPFAPIVRKLIQLSDRATPVTFLNHNPLESWVHEGYKVLVIGDAGEPSPPHTLHGLAAPMGDGLVLGTLFSRLSSPAQIPVLLEAFDEMRKPRVRDLFDDEASVMGYFMLPAGPAMEERNAGFRAAHAMTATAHEVEMDDGLRRVWDSFIKTASYDAYESACDWWTKWGAAVDKNTGMSLEIPVETEVEVT